MSVEEAATTEKGGKMSADTTFKLATVSKGGVPYAALIIGDHAVRIDELDRHFSKPSGNREWSCTSLLGMLQNWDFSFERLCQLAEFAAREGLGDPKLKACTATTADVRFHAPVPRPPGMFFAVVNYPRPAKEGKDVTSAVRRPYVFEKAARSAIGPYDDIIKPVGFDKIDWEVELAFIVGRGGSHIRPERAADHIAGYLIANDITCRGFRQEGELPIKGPDWFGSKCHDSFCPLGPYFVPRAFVPDSRDLRLIMKINGEVRQDGNTRDMLYGPEELLAHVSNQLTLEPGDLFSTGTPEGFGAQSARFLKPGDIVEAEIPGLGAQRNRLVKGAAG
jgi:2,4-diketo-3-deoxy-L-fuconate hydrolase